MPRLCHRVDRPMPIHLSTHARTHALTRTAPVDTGLRIEHARLGMPYYGGGGHGDLIITFHVDHKTASGLAVSGEALHDESVLYVAGLVVSGHARLGGVRQVKDDFLSAGYIAASNSRTRTHARAHLQTHSHTHTHTHTHLHMHARARARTHRTNKALGAASELEPTDSLCELASGKETVTAAPVGLARMPHSQVRNSAHRAAPVREELKPGLTLMRTAHAAL
jgi:hypothetical protein